MGTATSGGPLSMMSGCPPEGRPGQLAARSAPATWATLAVTAGGGGGEADNTLTTDDLRGRAFGSEVADGALQLSMGSIRGAQGLP